MIVLKNIRPGMLKCLVVAGINRGVADAGANDSSTFQHWPLAKSEAPFAADFWQQIPRLPTVALKLLLTW